MEVLNDSAIDPRACIEVDSSPLYDVSPHERLLAARALGDYSRDYCVCQVLLAALQDPSATVRCEIYKLLSRTEFSKYEGAMLLVVARRIRYALELEEEGSASWYCGKRALDRLSDYY